MPTKNHFTIDDFFLSHGPFRSPGILPRTTVQNCSLPGIQSESPENLNALNTILHGYPQKPRSADPMAGCRLHSYNQLTGIKKKRTRTQGPKIPSYIDKDPARRRGSARELPARTAGALSSYKLFRTLSVSTRLISDSGLCERARWQEKIAAGVDGMVGKGR